MSRTFLTIILAAIFSTILSHASEPSYRSILGTFQGAPYNGKGEKYNCSLRADEDVTGMVSIQVTVENEVIQYPKIRRETLQKAIQEGRSGGFDIGGKQIGLLGGESWYLGGEFSEVNGNLLWIRIAYTKQRPLCLFPCWDDEESIDLSCSHFL